MPEEMTFGEFVALRPAPAQFAYPVATNIRKRIVERMAAALEFAQYGEGGALGRPILAKIKRDFGSEIGVFEADGPVLMVIPVETTSATGDYIAQEHQIHIQIDITGGEADAEKLTEEVFIYLRAIIIIVLSLQLRDFNDGIPTIGGVQWDVINHSYDSLRRKKGTSIYKRSASCRLELKTAENLH